MPIVFNAKLDGTQAVLTHYFPLAGFYLGTALRSAEDSCVMKDSNDVLRDVIISITFSAMAIEAWANEIAEHVLKNEALEDFIRLKRKYEKTEKCSAILFKHKILMKEKNHPPIKEEVIEKIEEIITIRNSLVHYKLSESSGKSHLRALSKAEASDPMQVWSVSFLERPVNVEPSLLERLSSSVAVQHYNTAYDFFAYWYELEGIKNAMRAFRRLPA